MAPSHTTTINEQIPTVVGEVVYQPGFRLGKRNAELIEKISSHVRHMGLHPCALAWIDQSGETPAQVQLDPVGTRRNEGLRFCRALDQEPAALPAGAHAAEARGQI